MEPSAEYLAKAQECRRLAKLSSDALEREQYEKMASSWDELARSMEVLRRRTFDARKPPA